MTDHFNAGENLNESKSQHVHGLTGTKIRKNLSGLIPVSAKLEYQIKVDFILK